jgi:hypothetical protein
VEDELAVAGNPPGSANSNDRSCLDALSHPTAPALRSIRPSRRTTDAERAVIPSINDDSLGDLAILPVASTYRTAARLRARRRALSWKTRGERWEKKKLDELIDKMSRLLPSR